MSKDVKSVIEEFHASVNMKQKDLESWLETDQSQAVGQKDGDSESIGHKSGKRILTSPPVGNTGDSKRMLRLGLKTRDFTSFTI
jgi:hypothetical protein